MEEGRVIGLDIFWVQLWEFRVSHWLQAAFWRQQRGRDVDNRSHMHVGRDGADGCKCSHTNDLVATPSAPRALMLSSLGVNRSAEGAITSQACWLPSNPSTSEVEEGYQEFKASLWLHSEFDASLCYMRPSLFLRKVGGAGMQSNNLVGKSACCTSFSTWVWFPEPQRKEPLPKTILWPLHNYEVIINNNY